MILRVDKKRSLKAIECIQRRCDEDADAYHLRLVVDVLGVLRIREEANGDYTPGTVIAVTIPYDIDPDKVLSAATDLNTRLGEIIYIAFQQGRDRDNAKLQEDVRLEFERFNYKSIYTFVTPEEWFDHADILVDEDTSDLEIEEYVENISSEAWLLGYEDAQRAVVDRLQMKDFLLAYRDGGT